MIYDAFEGDLTIEITDCVDDGTCALTFEYELDLTDL